MKTLAFVEELNHVLAQMNSEQLARQLDAFGLPDEADKCRAGRMTEEEARALVFLCCDTIRSIDRAKARHMKKQARKHEKK